MFVFTHHFAKLTKVAPLAKISACFAAVVFLEVWVSEYAIPEPFLSDNGPQLAVKFFNSVSRSLSIANVYTCTHRPETNGQVERYNRTVVAVLRNYVNEHEDDWDVYTSALTYVYDNQIHKSKQSKLFELVLSRPRTDFTLHPNVVDRPAATRETSKDFLKRMDIVMQRAYGELEAMEERCKRSFDKSVRRVNGCLRADDFV